LAEIVNRAPKSLEGLKAVEGIGEGFCRDYGAAVLESLQPIGSPARIFMRCWRNRS
jgi:hypothetical protein